MRDTAVNGKALTFSVDAVNGKALTSSVEDHICKVFDLDNYELLFSKSDKEVQQVKTG
jgi:hypothetical protein